MTLNEFLIKAHELLDAATVDDGLGNEALCMLNLGKLHGLLIVFIEQTPTEKSEHTKNSRPSRRVNKVRKL